MNDLTSSTKIKFSIIVIAYNKAEALKACIVRLLHMADTYDTEIILIDNNDDKINRSQLVNNFKNKIYIKNSKNLGVSEARNQAIKKSKGDYLILLDDDVYIKTLDFKEKIEKSFLLNVNLSAMSFRIQEKRDNQQWKDFPDLLPHTNKALSKDKHFQTSWFDGTACAIRRTSLRKVGLFLTDLSKKYETVEISYRMFASGLEVYYNPDVIIYHNKDYSNENINKNTEVLTLDKLITSYIHFPDSIIKSYRFNALLDLFTKTKSFQSVSHVKKKFRKWLENNENKRTPLNEFWMSEIKRIGIDISKT